MRGWEQGGAGHSIGANWQSPLSGSRKGIGIYIQPALMASAAIYFRDLLPAIRMSNCILYYIECIICVHLLLYLSFRHINITALSPRRWELCWGPVIATQILTKIYWEYRDYVCLSLGGETQVIGLVLFLIFRSFSINGWVLFWNLFQFLIEKSENEKLEFILYRTSFDGF